MLISANSFEKLDFPSLMEIYIEGNLENGAYFWPEESPESQMKLAVEAFRDYLVNGFYGTANGTYWIWVENGRYASALRLEEHGEGLLLEALETRPDCRKMGHAKQLIFAVLEQLPEGTRVYSHIDRENIPSLVTHESCGFSRAPDYAVDSEGNICEHEVTMEVTVSRRVL